MTGYSQHGGCRRERSRSRSRSPPRRERSRSRSHSPPHRDYGNSHGGGRGSGGHYRHNSSWGSSSAGGGCQNRGYNDDRRPTPSAAQPGPSQGQRLEEPKDDDLKSLLENYKRCNKCIFSDCGLQAGYLENNPLAKRALENVCGTLPSKVPRSCKGTLKNEHGLKQHAETFSKAPVAADDSDDDEEAQTIQKGHALLHDYLHRTIPMEEQLAQAHRQVRGQAVENKATQRKLVASHQQEKSSLVERNVQLQATLDEQAKQHQHAMEAKLQAHSEEMMQLKEEFGHAFTDEARRMELLEADKRQIQEQLEYTRRGLQTQEEKRKAEIAKLADELQSTSREVERENLERLREEHKRMTEAAQQRLQQKEEALKKAEQDKAELQKEMQDEAQHYGALMGKDGEYKAASETVFDALKRFRDDPRAPWREFGCLETNDLRGRGLKPEDIEASSAWQQGFWLAKPDDEHDSAHGPPFIAEWAFKRVSEDPVQYAIRDEDEVIRSEMPMPGGMPPRTRTLVKSAAFVQHLRHRYNRGKADSILNHLLDKYVEYKRHSSGLGYSGYSVIRKLWNEDQKREMTLPEMCELLVSLLTAR